MGQVVEAGADGLVENQHHRARDERADRGEVAASAHPHQHGVEGVPGERLIAGGSQPPGVVFLEVSAEEGEVASS